MNKFLHILLATSFMIACTRNESQSPSNLQFPLKQAFTLPVSEDIYEVTSSSDLIFVRMKNSIIAFDNNTQEVLWNIDISVSQLGEGFQVVEDKLIAATREDVFIIDKLGQQNKINLQVYDSPAAAIIKVLEASPEYLYVLRGDWSLEAYDIAKNTMLWKTYVGREIGAVHYSTLDDIVYVITNDYIKAFENSTGSLIWEMQGAFGGSVLDNEILYISEDSDEQIYRIFALNTLTQKRLWEKNIAVPPRVRIGNLKIIDNLLIASGEIGFVTVDKTTGELIWKTDVNDDISVPPISFDGILYAKGIHTHTLYAVSLDEGLVVGRLQLEEVNLFDSLNLFEAVSLVSDGIVFHTKKELVIYKNK